MKDPNPRIRARIPHELWVRFMASSQREGNSQSKILTSALASHFSYEIDDQRDARILERLDLMTRHYHRLNRDVNLFMETFSLYLQYYFTMSPRVPETEKDARASQGVVDLNQFIDRLGDRVQSGRSTFKDALDDVLISDEDFFRMDEINLLEALLKKREATSAKEAGHE